MAANGRIIVVVVVDVVIADYVTVTVAPWLPLVLLLHFLISIDCCHHHLHRLLILGDFLQRNSLIRVVQFLPQPLWRLQRTEHGSENNAIEDNARQDEGRPSPAKLPDQVLGEGREDERSKATSTNGDSRCQGAILFEISRHTDDGRQVDESESEACAHTHGKDECQNVLGKGTDHQTYSGENGSRYGHRPAAVLVDKGRGDGTGAERHSDQQRDDQGCVALALVKVGQEFLVEDAVRVGDSIGWGGRRSTG